MSVPKFKYLDTCSLLILGFWGKLSPCQNRWQWYSQYGHGRTIAMVVRFCRRKIPIYVCVSSTSICHSSRRQSMTKPSPDIFEALSIQSYDKMTGAFSHHSDARPAHELWVTCALTSVLHTNDGNLQTRGQIKPFSQPTS